MIFEDPSQKRWKKARLTFGLILVVFILLLGAWVSSLIVNPPLPSFVKKLSYGRAINNIAQLKKMTAVDTVVAKATSTKARPSRFALTAISTSSTTLASINPGGLLSTAFLVQNDAESIRSYKDHSNQIDIVIPDWYVVVDNTCSVIEREDPEITKIIKTNGNASIFPRISNVRHGVWQGDAIGQILLDSTKRDCLAGMISRMLASTTAKGINVDFESLAPEDRDGFLEFLITLTDLLHKQNKLVTVDVPARDPAFDLQYIGKIVDGVILMSYDEHYSGGQPGAIASTDWFNDTFDEVAAEIPSSKLIVALGQYAYDWQVGASSSAKSMSFEEVIDYAKDLDAQPELESATKNMFFAYTDDNKKNHEVWFLNGVTAWNEYKYLKSKKVLGLSLWRLGTEDPSFWDIYDASATADSFINVPALSTVRYETEGELFRVMAQPQAGKLEITTDDTGAIDYAQYQILPSGYVMQRVGNEIPPNGIVLSFDDGPDQAWTPQILDILTREKVPAVFFVVGEQAQRFPDILGQMAKGGFYVGNHTYLHPDISTISDNRIHLELNRTNRLIETVYGRKTALFRPPYNTDTTPTDPVQLRALDEVNRLGYIIMGANIDAEDWQKPGVEQIVKNVETGLANQVGHVIVMHDAGGERSQTVEALKILIPDLRAKGYQFMSLDQATGINRNLLMPPLESKEWFYIKATQIFLFLKDAGWLVISWLFLLTTLISIARLLFMGNLVLRSIGHFKRKKASYVMPDELVTVLVPAYNEEKTIGKTLDALKLSTYTNLEILVVNDGSKDATSDVVRGYMSDDSRIRLIEKENGGKSSAANLGLREAKGELIVAIDADTITFPFTIGELIKPFSDKTVDAVCGNVEVGNVRNLLTGFQSLEYITSQNFDRRAFDELNCISVVPGATGAWRKSKIISIGGYTSDTLVEDADLTLRLLVAGGRVVYAPEARSRTEAPETVSALAKQRFRWSFGTFQCLRKNSDQFFKGSLGWVALPNMFMFQVVFPILSPIGDLILILSIIRGDVQSILAGYLMFIAMDVFGSLLAFSLEKRSKKLMWLILIQRFFYRQFMYYITYKSIIAIFKGRKHGWNKLERRGTVKL
jgi:cellulose synthase/poly-beta-1,6-N-acetylglucosamine synthase-like glycosyltransferase/spore germination protein YaaH/peptidoglycan/xylan/chitin deacetylase (PgdA/CDA1 family)